MVRGNSGAVPAMASIPSAVDTVTSSGVSQQAAITAKAGQVWSITSTGNVYINFGSNPTAAADSGWYVAAGQTREFVCEADGEKVALMDG